MISTIADVTNQLREIPTVRKSKQVLSVITYMRRGEARRDVCLQGKELIAELASFSGNARDETICFSGARLIYFTRGTICAVWVLLNIGSLKIFISNVEHHIVALVRYDYIGAAGSK